MSDLTEKRCEACSVDAPQATQTEIDEYIDQIPNWEIVEVDGIKRLNRVFKFKNYMEALAFTNRVAELAEAENHHPAILTEWGKVTVTWWTHKIKSLHVNDFVMAAKTDRTI